MEQECKRMGGDGDGEGEGERKKSQGHWLEVDAIYLLSSGEAWREGAGGRDITARPTSPEGSTYHSKVAEERVD